MKLIAKTLMGALLVSGAAFADSKSDAEAVYAEAMAAHDAVMAVGNAWTREKKNLDPYTQAKAMMEEGKYDEALAWSKQLLLESTMAMAQYEEQQEGWKILKLQ
ncbi:MAG: hypothetical protein HWE20_02900 [Gammaproteobacteria bacterium]|nr:hypothetical protein [Gammaproteobacteria bacterium]